MTCFDPVQPGFLDFSYRLKALAKQYQLTVISQVTVTQAELLIKEANYVVIPILNGKIGWIKYIWQCARYIKKQKPDVVMLLHSALSPMSFIVGNVPTCLYWNEHPTNLMRYSNLYSPLNNLLTYLSHQLIYLGARTATCVMPIGEDHRDDLLAHRINPNNLEMIYMGVSDSFFIEREINKPLKNFSPIQLIYIGTVSEIRGRDVMLEAMMLIAQRRVAAHLTIVGACEEQLKYCKQRINDLGLQNYVSIFGRVSGEYVPTYLMQADIGICLWEKNPWCEFNPPTKLFEYLAAGLPVLASNIRTHTRYIQDWKNGLIFDYNSASLAQVIESLNTYQKRIPALKVQAKNDGKQFAWSLIEPVFLAKFNQILRDS